MLQKASLKLRELAAKNKSKWASQALRERGWIYNARNMHQSHQVGERRMLAWDNAVQSGTLMRGSRAWEKSGLGKRGLRLLGFECGQLSSTSQQGAEIIVMNSLKGNNNPYNPVACSPEELLSFIWPLKVTSLC